MPETAMQVARRALDRMEGHEKLCADRWQTIRDDVKDMKNTMSTFSKIAVGVLVALVGYFGNQLLGPMFTHH